MRKRTNLDTFFILLIFLVSSSVIFSQNNKQKELETRRQELRREIQKIAELRSENKSKEKSQLSLIENFNYKISVLNNLIKVTNQQANLLTRAMNSNQKQITALRNKLKQLKENYGAMIVKSYKSKNEQSRIMFLLSSNNFKQTYKRLQYMKQYRNHQKAQGESIKAKTIQLQEINKRLSKQKEEKNKLIADNRMVQKSLEAERKQHEALMESIKKNLSFYTVQIRTKQREANKIDKELERIIKAAIAKSNKKAGKSSTSKGFALTSEDRALARNFESNKGKLNWPVEKGIVKMRYGRQQSPINKNIYINSNGVRIATVKGSKARAIFNGEVIGVVRMKNVKPIVMIRHGNYITYYKNLSKVYVKDGDKVTTKQEIGEIFTNKTSGETVLSFSISKESITQNPALWIYKM